MLVKADVLVIRLRAYEVQQLRDLRPVRVVLIAAHLQVLVELLVELSPCGLLVFLVILFLIIFCIVRILTSSTCP